MSFSIFGKRKEDKKTPASDNSNIGSTISSATTSSTTDRRASASFVERRHVPTVLVDNLPVLEDAAILFAGTHIEAAQQVLQTCIHNEYHIETNAKASLMLLDLYQFTGNQPKFEQFSTEYATKFKIAAPIWMAKQSTISFDLVQSDCLVFPAKIEGNIQTLIGAIIDFSGERNSIKFDCSQLVFLGFSACAELLNGLIPIASRTDASIEFVEVSPLVMPLLQAMGFNTIAKISGQQR